MTDERANAFAAGAASRVKGQFSLAETAPRLRLSQMGPRCPKALWSSIHTPELAEALPPWAQFKYTYGHLIEALAIGLAQAAGHEVTGEQDEVVLDDIVGHRDCVIDGVTVDVKSTTSHTIREAKAGRFSDLFGYLDQLDGYVLAAREDPLVRVKDVAYDLFIDRQLGHMYLHKHEVTDGREKALRDRIVYYKSIVARSEPPRCECGTERDENGNVRLDTKAGYNPYKHCCFPGLRTFLYSKGPVYLSYVAKRPFNKDGPIAEVDKYGNFV
jgi:hypothetical protein